MNVILSIHDHTNSHCFVKILKGELLETRFEWPDQKNEINEKPMQEIESEIYSTNQVTYISGILYLKNLTYRISFLLVFLITF